MIFIWLFCSLGAIEASKNHKGKDCGLPSSSVEFTSIDITPHPVKYPGTLSVSLTMKVIQPLPEDVTLSVVLFQNDKRQVPCVMGYLGSCEYDVCDYLKTNPKRICPFFPSGVECKCPLKPGIYQHKKKTLDVTLPDYGTLIGNMISGSYTGNFSVFSKASPEKKIGCAQLPTFQITT